VKSLTVRDFLDSLSQRVEFAVVNTTSSLQEVVRAMLRAHRRRTVYVVDSAGKLQGAISLDALKDVIFRYYLDGRIWDALVVTEHVAELFTSEKAEDLMDATPSLCGEDEQLQEVLSRMIERNVMEMPVIDHEQRVVAELDILDLLESWLKKGEEAF
jgi:CBS domain-containing protein